MAPWYYRDHYTTSVPREAKGGIKSQSKRGQFGQSWWAKRWIAVLESFNIGARLGRGRNYARKGQVVSIDVAIGAVTAEVQGSRAKPYAVTIRVKTLSTQDWNKVAAELSKQALFAAKLLAGEMPENIEDVFKQTKLSLFPQKVKDLSTECSCPDWSNPCKHIAAAYYLLGEEFDRDPFLIFKLRGMDRDQLVKILGGHTATKSTEAAQKDQPLPDPLPADHELFWGRQGEVGLGEVEVSTPAIHAALPKRLGKFPLWRGGMGFLECLEDQYAAASQVGLDVFLGEHGKSR